LCALGECERAPHTAARQRLPYWEIKPNLPNRPSEFCAKASDLFERELKATDVHCQDSLAGAYGIRGKRDRTEVILLQGAEEKWFAFSYVVEDVDPHMKTLDAQFLQKFIGKVEAALSP
jgi:hypothetical protein